MKINKQTFGIIIILILSGVLGFAFSLYEHREDDDALQPPNDARLIETFHSPAIFVKQLAGDPQAGRKIFKEFCSTCHAKEPLIDIRAPRVGDKKTWGALRQIGIDKLLDITIQGAGAMPARGGCFECSDEQLRETIKFMLVHSQ